ncbi:ExeM/NucH family extracellular endonuclease [Psychromonas sp. Urea-02u-13]|uniref:ExeM/NucH family extracellular endonuclease n=1 Tax=Psychromonas sp. Urea-02u-13 TaxID=2058326 RepID=UPI000C3372EA|nr:ExeM/NucH family extracellular endonuclease [Psychromonas sp. Urea-02u-13]PKG37658.1 endonuclease/exonuclease/phosphatase [Psychromonas sp. Urea-02u-13]
MKKNFLALSIGAALSLSAQADIIISEYVEGGSYNKAIEIANTGEQSVTLDGYALAKSHNGNGEWGATMPLDGITLEADGVYVVVNGRASDTIKAIPGAVIDTHSVVGHNGDDPIALIKDGVVHDIVGEMGDVDFAKDKTLIRRVYTPSALYDKTQWQEFTKDNIENLGQLDAGQEPAEPTEPVIGEPTTIMALQGESWASPETDVANGKYISDNTFVVEGIITTLDYSGGFFIQDETGDGNNLTSDGIFVLGSTAGLSVGDKVAVTGKIKEDFGWTKLESTLVSTISAGNSIEATPLRTLESDEDFDFTLERHEGMLVAFDKAADMHITRSFGYSYSDRRNNLTVSHERVNQHPNQSNAPSAHEGAIDSAAEIQTDSNEDKRVVVESFTKAPNGVVPWYPDFGKASIDQNGSSDDYLRIGDVIDGLEGVLTYSYNDYRFYVTNEASKESFAREATDRSATPVLKEGDLRVATFNVLNYFNSPFDGEANPTGQNRGAETADDFEKQATKIVQAMLAIDADILGLMEIENNGFGESSAVVDLVNRLNENLEIADQYSITQPPAEALTEGFIGTDAITTMVIFKAAKVSLDGVRIINMPEQHAPEITIEIGGKEKTESGDNYMRHAVTPTFSIAGTDEKLTVSVNHFKSKGSACWEDYALQAGGDPDKQGQCENFRVSAAYQLGKVMATIEGHKLIMGDLNSYANEDPMMVLTNRDNAADDYILKAARDTFIGDLALHGEEGAVISESYGYLNVIKEMHPQSHSYSYNDEVGTLDYILASASLKANIVDSMDWNINSSESTLFEYPSKYTGDLPKYDDAYSSSDHDPAIVILNFNDKQSPVIPVVTPEFPTQIELPVELPEIPTAVTSGAVFKVAFNLLEANKSAQASGKATLVVGDIASIIIRDGIQQRSVKKSMNVQKTLTPSDFSAGYVEFEIPALAEGDYTMTKIITDAQGSQKFASPNVTFSVKEKSTTDATGNTSGGSAGMLSLFAMLGFGFLRRKKGK